MHKELHFLLLEDVPSNAELIERRLRRAHLPFSLRCVQEKEDFVRELEEFTPDLILADYSLPSFDGLSALAISQEKCPHVPFIFVSGAIGEDMAIETLRKGATDYVLKDHLRRLVPTVCRALHEAEERAKLKQAEEALRKSEEKYRSLYESSKDGIVSSDMEGNLLDANQAFLDMVGYTVDQTKKLTYQRLTPRKWHEMEKDILKNEIMKRGYSNEYEKEYIKKDGTVFPVTIRVWLIKDGEGKLKGTWAIVRDITERKLTEKALRDAQGELVRKERLAVLGQLAGGVAHELRNPLGAIKNAAYFLKMALKKPDREVKETVDILEKEVATSERIISSLLGFTRPKPPIRRKVDIKKLLKEVLSHMKVPDKIEVARKLDESLPTLLADPLQISQGFSNIILNAIQAMPEGGKLTIKSELVSPNWIAVSFTDTGVGIPKKNLEKLFEPLFTTKARGIGLGLALTRTLIEGHGGTIKVESKEGKGATFTLRLPIDGGKEG